MVNLTMNLENSATVLGMDTSSLRQYAEENHLEGVIRFNNQWRVSIFTLAGLLNTSPDNLIELLEDQMLGELLESDEAEKTYDKQESIAMYQRFLAGEE